MSNNNDILKDLERALMDFLAKWIVHTVEREVCGLFFEEEIKKMKEKREDERMEMALEIAKDGIDWIFREVE